MVQATIERNNTSVGIDLLADASGTPLVVRSVGKPNQQIQSSGALDPRHIDQWSGLEQYQLTGALEGSDAYDRAATLCDLIKSNGNGTPLTLNIGMPDYETDITVVPGASQDEACQVIYQPGWRDYVEVDLALTRISETVGGLDQPAQTPTANGSGPITLNGPNNSVEITSDVEITRGVGRPQSVVRRTPEARYPRHVEKTKAATDVFELSFEFSENTVSTTNTLVDMFTRKLGRSTLTLDFKGVFGLGAFDVVPEGSDAMRHNRRSGYAESGFIPSVTLRRALPGKD